MKCHVKTYKPEYDRFKWDINIAGGLGWIVRQRINLNKEEAVGDSRFWINKEFVTLKKAIKILGGKCVECGCSDIRVLEIDHINGDGGKERKQKGHYHIGEAIVQHPEEAFKKYQVLYANCNLLKMKLNNEFPQSKYSIIAKIRSDDTI